MGGVSAVSGVIDMQQERVYEMRLATAIGYAVRAERQRVGMTQEELAERAGLARFTVTSIEGGTAPTIATLQKVANGLGMTASLLISQAERLQRQ